jgi:DNA repair protein RadA/Sms
MAKPHTNYVCQECGSVTKKWAGRCEACGAWNTIHEEQGGNDFSTLSVKPGKKLNFESLGGDIVPMDRILTTLAELDRVLGGGLVRGSAILIGGDPGIGKSTLLLQLVASLATNGMDCAYISGEESLDQIRLRALRLGMVAAPPVKMLSATNVGDIIATLEAGKSPDIVVIDSIQTMFIDSFNSAPGTVSQVRAAAHELIKMAKSKGIILLLVGHVTKDGQIAGPKVLEHMVDTVLYFEGERGHEFRILRAVKNRFGSVNEIGVFQMSGHGLEEVPNPSALFLSQRERAVSGAAVFAGMEGSRPVLVEIQALVSPSMLPTPRRAVVGWDSNRLAMIIAVLGVRYGLMLADKEVYLNVAGGLRVLEPAADLAVAAALVSSVMNIPLPQESVIFGEVGLSGEVRIVGHTDIRLKEAAKLGFTQAIIPTTPKLGKSDVAIKEIMHIKGLKDFFAKG